MRWLTVPLLLLLACDSADSESAEASDPPARGDTYVAGLEKAGADGQLVVRLLDSQPAPPQRDENVWTLEVADMDGEPLTGCEIVLDPDMPAHGHGTYVDAEVTEMDTAGQYVADPVLLFMPGLWVVPITVQCGNLGDTVEYSFDIEG